MNERTRYLAIDYGEKRVGIAVSDEDKKYSFSRDYIFNDKSFFEKLEAVLRNENISRIIVGYPLNFNSEKTIQTLKVEQFKTELQKFLISKSLNIEICFFDERLTSRIASQSILDSGLKKSKRREKGLVDSISAQIILQDYLDSIKN